MSAWAKTTLGDVSIKIGSGATPTGGSNAYKDSGISLIRSQNVLDFKFSKNGLAYIDDKQAHELRNVIVDENDILLNITGDSVARCCVVPAHILPARVNQHVAIIRPQPEKADYGFIYYLLQSMKDELLMQAEIGATRNALTKGMLEALEIALPSLEEQKSIASVLSSLDNKIDLLHRQNKTLEAMAETLFRQWFVEGVGDWEEGKIEDLFVLQRGFDLPLQNRISGQYPIFASSGFSGYHSEYKVKAPGITTGRSGVLGNVFLVLEDFWPLNTSLYIKEFKRATPLYAFYILKNLDLNSYNAGSAVPTLNRNHVHEATVLIPPDNLIQEFEGIASLLFKKINKNEIQIRQVEKIRDGLLPKLMSGEVKVA